jgi:hypothetical protein
MDEAPKPRHLLSAAHMRALDMAVPEVLAMIEAALGAGAMHRLVNGVGGRRVFIPERAAASASVLAGSCGADVAEWLSDTLGPGPFEVPLGPAAARPRAIAAILVGLSAGESNARLSERTGLHERSITRILADLRRTGAALASITKELTA